MRVVSLQAFGMFVEVFPGQQGLVHVSELDIGRVNDAADLFKLGDTVDVMCLEILPGGKMKLSRCAFLLFCNVLPAAVEWRYVGCGHTVSVLLLSFPG